MLAMLLSFGIPGNDTNLPPFKDKYRIYDQSEWVDSAMATLNLDDKIGQLFMVAAFSSGDKMNLPEVQRLVDDYHIGGVIFFKGSPVKQAEMTNFLQSRSMVPLLVGIDAEWGLAMRLDSTVNFGYQMPMGAIDDDSLIYQMGRELALECRRLGINVNFAPVVDVNNNPLNPVINLRSFGENKHEVARKGFMYMKGLQDEHVLAVAKHFPGHGNVSVDSHLDLPLIQQSASEMDTLELFPFKYLFARGVGGVMTAHLQIPAYDTAQHVGASLSHYVCTDLLRNQLHFHGLAFSDALNMKGVAKYFQPGEVELRALMAGNDVLLYSEDVPLAIKTIRKAVEDSCLSESIIDAHVRRILAVKHWCGLVSGHNVINTQNLTADLNNPGALLIKQKLAEEAITVVKNRGSLIPLRRPDTLRTISIAIGTVAEPPFQTMMRMYSRADYFTIPMNAPDSIWNKMRDTLKNYNLSVISLHNLSNRKTATFGLSDNAVRFINDAPTRLRSVLVSFGSPYALSRFPDYDAIIEAYQDEKTFQSAAGQVLFGGLQATARLPVTAENFTSGMGVNTAKPIRLQYTLPEELGINSLALMGIDSIVKSAIERHVFPGCQVLAAYRGKVIYNKSFGTHTYDPSPVVLNSDLYDLASVTKVAATTLAAMKLYEEGKLNLFSTLGDYLPEVKETNKKSLQIRELMTHQAGLKDWIPFYKKTLNPAGQADSLLYTRKPDSLHSIRVANGMYLDRRYRDTLYKNMDESELKDRGTYKYSDLGFLYMQRVIEKITCMPLDHFVDSVFYKPLGLSVTTFRPYEKFPLDRIAPTEMDTVYRRQLVHGDVHDPAAAMLGGVAGNAGLFSNASDMAVIMQMLLDNGTYAGHHFLNSATIKLFTRTQFEGNYRGLGWDKPPFDMSHGSPASQYASSLAFGHTGFTGTCIWADPRYDLVFIFLSNRVNPSAAVNLLARYNIRTDIHDILYQAIEKK
jgi:beta-glucosidase-like glycosyl hydrolase/CubicO group peptidase (beta-lactamase class C family)